MEVSCSLPFGCLEAHDDRVAKTNSMISAFNALVFFQYECTKNAMYTYCSEQEKGDSWCIIGLLYFEVRWFGL